MSSWPRMRISKGRRRSSRPVGPDAFLVDAMRFAMAHEFVEMLPTARDTAVKPAAAAWPTITPVGMAALLPGASAGFSVVESGGKLAAKIGTAPLKDVNERLKFLK